ncbi:MAG TPA: alpha/beta hydrolase, partial [Vicinamibacteria bacterium]|nr:alpha/beta hydrolase [Vicinamibacteria bacterium]
MSRPVHVTWLRTAMAVSTAVSPRLAARWAETLFFRPPRPKKARTSLPAGGQRIEVLGETGPLAVWSWGQGPAVYLVHGWGGRAEQLGAFVGPLTARGYRVVAVDGPGHGASAGQLSSAPEIGRALATVVRAVAPA